MWRFGAAKIIDIVRTVKAKISEHIRYCRSGLLTHHRGRTKAERVSDVEINETVVLDAEEVEVSGVDAQLPVGVAEILLKEKASRAFLKNDRYESVSAG